MVASSAPLSPRPAREPAAILAAPCIHTGARLVCLLLRLLLNRAGPLICRSHGSWIPTTRDRLRLALIATPHRRLPRRLRRHAPSQSRNSSPATTSPASSSRTVSIAQLLTGDYLAGFVVTPRCLRSARCRSGPD